MKHTIIALVGVLCFGIGEAQAQAKLWGLVTGDAVNVHADFIDVTYVLLEQHLSESGVTVVRVSAEDAAKGSYGDGVTAVVRFSIVRMGETVKISVQKLDLDGTVQAASNMTAASPDDLDSVTARLARHLVTGVRPNEGETIYEVTDRERERLKKKRSTTYYGVRVIGAHSFSSELSQHPMKYGAGFSVLYDPRSFLAEVSFDMYGGSTGDFQEFSWELGVGGFYPLTDLNFSPYVGGILSLSSRWAEWNERDWDSDTGLTVAAALGMLLGRTSDIILRFEVRFFVDTYSIEGDFSSGIAGFGSIGF